MTNLSLPSEISSKQVTDNAELPVSGPVDKVADEDSVKPFDSHLPTEKTELGDSAATDKEVPANDDRSLSRSRVSRHAHKGEKDGAKEKKKGDEIAGEELCSMGQLTFPPLPGPMPRSDKRPLTEPGFYGGSSELESAFSEITGRDTGDHAKTATSEPFLETQGDLEAKAPAMVSTMPKSSTLPIGGTTTETSSIASSAKPAASQGEASTVDVGLSNPNLTQISHPNQPSLIPAKTSSQGQQTLRDPGVASKNSSSSSSRQPIAVDSQTGLGTDVARQHARMSAASKETRTEQTMPVATPLPTSAAVSIPRVVLTSPARDFSSADRETSEALAPEEKMGQTNQSPTEFLILSSQDARPAQNDGMPAKVTHLFNAITDTIEKLQTDGHTNVEMKVKLPDGQQLTVRLQLHAGEVRAVFRTDSTEWREAITRGWSDIAGNSAERGVRLTDPTFESPGTHAGFDNLNQQPRDRRDDAELTANDAPFVPGSKKHPKSKVSPTSPSESLSPSRPTKLGAAGLVAWA